MSAPRNPFDRNEAATAAYDEWYEHSRRIATLESEVRNIRGDGIEHLAGKARGTFAIFERRS
jgi:hypothetical protein